MGVVLIEKAIVDDKLRIRSCTIEDVDLQDENIINITVAKSLIYNKSATNIWQLNDSEQSDASNQSMIQSWEGFIYANEQQHCWSRLEFAYFFPKVRKVTSKHPFLCTNVYLVTISIIQSYLPCQSLTS